MSEPIVQQEEPRGGDAPRSARRPTVFAACALILLADAGLWVVVLALFALRMDAASAMNAANLMYYLPFVLLPAGLYMARREGAYEALRLNPAPVSGALAASALALLSVYAASALATLWQLALSAFGVPPMGSLPPPDGPRALALSILTLAAVPAVCEELLFRGVVFAAWEERGLGRAAAVSAALFALLHGNVTGLPAYLLVGAVGAWLVYTLDSLYAGIIYHTVYNAACVVIPYLAAGQAEAEAEAVPDGLLLLSMAPQILLVFALIGALLLWLTRRAGRMGVAPVPRTGAPLTRRDRAMLLAAVLALLANNIAIAALAARAGGA